MKKLLRVAAVAVTGLSFAAPALASAATGDVSTAGPNSPVTVRARHDSDVRVRNNNHLDLRNTSSQTAHTGDAKVANNSTVGGVGSGSAANDNMTEADVTVSNNSSSAAGVAGGNGGGDASLTATTEGPNSPVRVNVSSDMSYHVNNDNHVSLTNTSTQNATSGDASAYNNSTVGDVTTGDATNVNTSSFTLNVSNE